jgi:hypothetical protein
LADVRASATVVTTAVMLKARVEKGRLLLDEPTSLPDGTVVELIPLDPGDWLTAEDRAALHQALRDSGTNVEAGHVIEAADLLRQLRSA